LATGDIGRLLPISFLSCHVMSCHGVRPSWIWLKRTAPFDQPTIKTLP